MSGTSATWSRGPRLIGPGEHWPGTLAVARQLGQRVDLIGHAAQPINRHAKRPWLNAEGRDLVLRGLTGGGNQQQTGSITPACIPKRGLPPRIRSEPARGVGGERGNQDGVRDDSAAAWMHPADRRVPQSPRRNPCFTSGEGAFPKWFQLACMA